MAPASTAPAEVRAHQALEETRQGFPAFRERFEGDWGMTPPESLREFWAFLRSLGPADRQALADLDLAPYGVADLLEEPGRPTRDGIDVRVHGRYYRDPPEFVTFLHGGSDGLHFGLWFDDGRTCAGVAGYHTDDGDGVGVPQGTPLEVVRAHLEGSWRDLLDEERAGAPVDERRNRLRGLRALLVAFGVGDPGHEGVDYLRTLPAARPLPERVMTLDGGGALLPRGAVPPRGPQEGAEDHHWYTRVYEELTGDPEAVTAAAAEAVRRCAAGDPAQALVLGRDLHWVSQGDPLRERLAAELLVAAYRALGRPALAGIVQAHRDHRDLPRVTVLR
ncbi:hypothetical protein ACQEU5_17190 [Marinactinospora thermotolerans]|uniref:hypothetical protein n=1 Tax=Marinactinospora thermotolerans TaxID=531310 RepID=UPI003D938F3E